MRILEELNKISLFSENLFNNHNKKDVKIFINKLDISIAKITTDYQMFIKKNPQLGHCLTCCNYDLKTNYCEIIDRINAIDFGCNLYCA